MISKNFTKTLAGPIQASLIDRDQLNDKPFGFIIV